MKPDHTAAGLSSCHVGVVDTLGAFKHESAVTDRRWSTDLRAAATSSCLECVCLFSLLGIVVSAAWLLAAPAETIAAVTAALMM